jgi:FMN phosphatase YigB (HAD superfamily)
MIKAKAVLFDLDGTLLPMEQSVFIQEYLKEISLAVQPAIEPDAFRQALLASTWVMSSSNNPEYTNEEVFWRDFQARLGNKLTNVRPLLEDFYSEKFCSLSYVSNPCQEAGILVNAAVTRGLRLVLATNPLFPLSAILDRMSWAGVAKYPWELITSYEIMHYCKPHQGYYLEIARQLGVSPDECLMVGNNVEEDLVAGELGMKTYLVTDCLLGDPAGLTKADWHGTIQQLAGLWGQQGIPLD